MAYQLASAYYSKLSAGQILFKKIKVFVNIEMQPANFICLNRN